MVEIENMTVLEMFVKWSDQTSTDDLDKMSIVCEVRISDLTSNIAEVHSRFWKVRRALVCQLSCWIQVSELVVVSRSIPF